MEFLRDSLSDQRHVKRNAIIQILIATLAFIMLVRVYPMGAVQKHTISKQQALNLSARDDLTGEVFTSNDKKLQTVYFSQQHLYQITLYLNCTTPGKEARAETILFRLYNDAFSCIYEDEYSCGDIENDGYLRTTVNMDVEPEQAYYYEILVPEDCSADIVLPIADRGALAQVENSTLYIDGIINDEVCLIADFDYSDPLSVLGILFYDVLIIAVAAALYLLVMWVAAFCDWRFAAYAAYMKTYARIAASVAAGLAALFLFLFSVILNKFGGAGLDRLFFAAAILVGALWTAGFLWLPVFYPKKHRDALIPAGRRISYIWRNYIQTVSFGLLFYALCQYVNADREYYHYINTRWMLIFLAIAFLMMFHEKQFLNKLSAVWLVLGVAGSIIYCSGITEGENELVLARLTCGVVVAWGVLIINILLQTRLNIRGEFRIDTLTDYVSSHIQQVVYAVLWIVFSIFMWVYRFEKVWVFTAVLPFLAMFFLKFTPASKSRFLKNFTNGILLSFGLVVLFCLHHRPHHYWMLYRYGGIFHTVACTGMYLAVVLGAALGKLYGKLRDRENMLQRCFKEFFIVACVIGFIILTMSRTAFVTSTVNIIMVAALAAVTYRKTPKRILQELGMLVGAMAVSFPMIFTVVRMVPAVVNDPVRYDIEFQDESFMIYKGDPIDSDKYMTVERFFSVLFGRFQSEKKEDVEEADADNMEAVKLLAYTGNDFAGIDMRKMANDLESASEEESGNDISNGRFEIFSDYLKALEFKGHPKMGPDNDTGEEYAHAHNSYLQVAYNFGMIAGGVFLVICALTLWRSARLAVSQGKKYSIYMVPFSLVVVFGFVSLTEWAFHPCIPAGFCFLLLQVLLVRE